MLPYHRSKNRTIDFPSVEIQKIPCRPAKRIDRFFALNTVSSSGRTDTGGKAFFDDIDLSMAYISGAKYLVED